MSRRFAIVALCLALAVRALMSFAADGFVRVAFCLPPAHAAAFYYGVPLDVEAVAFAAHGVAMEVTRACAAIDFFSIVCGLFAAKAILSRGVPAALRCAALVGSAPAAYIATVAANSLRLIALVPVDSALPRSSVPVVHLLAGASVFLGVFLTLCVLMRLVPRCTPENTL